MKSALLVLVLLLSPYLAWAHPHEWVDWGVGLVMGEGPVRTVVSARLELTWDEWFSSLVLADFPGLGKGPVDPVDLGRIDSSYGLGSEDRAVTLAVMFQGRTIPVKRTLTAVRSDGKQVTLVYTLPLGLSVEAASQLRISVYDPTFYADMGIRHQNGAFFQGLKAGAPSPGTFFFAQDLGHAYYGGTVYPEVVVFSLNP